MAINIAGVIVLGALILVLGILSGASIVSTVTVGESAFLSGDLSGKQARTKLEFVTAQGGSGGLTLQIKNTGLTSVYDYDEMDIIVEYLDASSNQISTRLTYTTGTLGNNEREKTSIVPDTNEPEAWNPNETISIDAILSPAQKSDSTASVTVGTPNGVPVVWTFGPSGFFWFTNAVDISLITDGSWREMDLSAFVPVGTTGAIIELVNTDTTGEFSSVIRGEEDTRDYISDLEFQRIEDETHRWQIVKVDSDRIIQGYVEDRQVDYKLLGYTMGSDPVYFNTPFDVTPATESAWTSVDVSSFVDSDADGVILFIVSTQDADRDYGVREVGSSFSTTNRDLDNYASTMYLVGLDANFKFEVYHEDFDDVKFYLVAQTKGSVVYYTNDLAVSDPSTGSFEEIDADTYSVPAVANGLILRIETSSILMTAVRHGDSTDDWTPDIFGGNHLLVAVGINDDNVWDEYIEGASVDVSIAAYTRTISN